MTTHTGRKTSLPANRDLVTRTALIALLCATLTAVLLWQAISFIKKDYAEVKAIHNI